MFAVVNNFMLCYIQCVVVAIKILIFHYGLFEAELHKFNGCTYYLPQFNMYIHYVVIILYLGESGLFQLCDLLL